MRVVAWATSALAVVAVATGVYVAFRYRPDASGFGLGMQRLHALSSIALAVVLVVGLAALVWARRPDRRHGLPAFAVIGVVAVLVIVEARLGWRLAWDQVALWAVPESLDRVQGVFLRDLALKFVVDDATEVGASEFRRRVWTHLLVLPLVVAAGTGLVVWWARRFGRARHT